MQADPEVADAAVVRRRYEVGASVRLLHPQRFSDSVWRVLSLLEDAFQCAVGCNVYLTPPASQVNLLHNLLHNSAPLNSRTLPGIPCFCVLSSQDMLRSAHDPCTQSCMGCLILDDDSFTSW